MSVTTSFRTLPAILLAIMLAPGAHAQKGIANSAHDLSVTGRGPLQAAASTRVCVFCHAPHSTAPRLALWNRAAPASSFIIYRSSTLDASPGQPTGSSKLCLSCHDGTIALGSVVSRARDITMVGDQRIPTGRKGYLGTDLSDDHPISLVYDSGLAASDTQLRSPALLPDEVRLDPGNQLQCTSCHRAHDNQYGDFLVMGNEFGQLCVACHQMRGWQSAAHENSSASVSGIQGADWKYTTVQQNACRSCHQTHGAGGRERLLRSAVEEDNCLVCHDGQVAAYDIQAVIRKRSSHDVRMFAGIHDPAEDLNGNRPHVECTDCHNPHAAGRATFGPGYQPIGGTLNKVRGVTIAGTEVDEAQYEYEVCFRCHGDAPVPIRRLIARQADTPNLRLRFGSTNESFHPVTTSTINPDVPSLISGIPVGSRMRCTDCHNNDKTRRSGGSGPDGPHGSMYPWLLERNYSTRDPTTESSFQYALCYKCHQRSSILGDDSFVGHKRHVQGQNTPCSVCHDPHGISSSVAVGTGDHTHLINFDLSVVTPNSMGLLEFVDRGRYAGSCSLSCHGKDHLDTEYHK